MNDRRTYKNKKFEQNERILIRKVTKRILDEDNRYLNEAMLKKTNIFLFSTLNEIIPVFLKIVRDTIIFERKAIKLGNITYQKIFPLLKEAKEILYNFYTKFLYFQIDLDSNYYLKALVSYFE
ncbi:hypothetical protein CWI38_0002p0040 [Hamiltosporidium tvaerminnensis]|uniref:Uncharacterized protein n=1 Tax=Hamiltosporidium tvaerminnensis TaxID=1176355 RepID=A0A4Q9M2L4_9MICR|nr:hypothetical protein CWI37_0004p0030 [Hamiltosporidium tvaerminnensis]TBU21020.1 hypothetical protein CWI38_0002p0040 [Hamiltosporidium tvaerminnensis]